MSSDQKFYIFIKFIKKKKKKRALNYVIICHKTRAHPYSTILILISTCSWFLKRQMMILGQMLDGMSIKYATFFLDKILFKIIVFYSFQALDNLSQGERYAFRSGIFNFHNLLPTACQYLYKNSLFLSLYGQIFPV